MFKYFSQKNIKLLSNQNQINLEILYPHRGKILDRNDIVIASNQITYDLFINSRTNK